MAPAIPDRQILDAVLDVVAEHGYAGATTRRIAQAAGVNPVTLFRRFSSKRELFMAAIEQEAELLSAARLGYTGDVEADLARIVDFYDDLVHRRGRMIVTLLDEVPRQPDLVELLATPRATAAGVAAVLARYQQEGVLVAEPPGQALAALVGPVMLYAAIAASGLSDLPGGTPPIEAGQHARRFLAGHASRGRPEPLSGTERCRGTGRQSG